MLLLSLECLRALALSSCATAPPYRTAVCPTIPIRQSFNQAIVQSGNQAIVQSGNHAIRQSFNQAIVQLLPNNQTVKQLRNRGVLTTNPAQLPCTEHEMSTVISYSPPARPLHPCLSKNNAGVIKKRVRSWAPTVAYLRVVHLNRTSNRVKKVYENDWVWFRTVDSANRAIVFSSCLDDWCLIQSDIFGLKRTYPQGTQMNPGFFDRGMRLFICD